MPYILEQEDLDEAERWVIVDVPLASVIQGKCKESAEEREERLERIRTVPLEQLFRPILELRKDGTVRLIDGGHRFDVAKERGLSSLSSLVKIARN